MAQKLGFLATSGVEFGDNRATSVRHQCAEGCRSIRRVWVCQDQLVVSSFRPQYPVRGI